MKRFLLLPACLVAAIVYALLDADSGVREWLRLRGALAASTARIEGLRRDVEALRVEGEALRTDPFASERAFREELELAKPGETVVLLPRSEGGTPRFP